MDNDKMVAALKDLFRPEFLNRVDEIVAFNPLTEDELLQIVDLLLSKTQIALDTKEIKLDISLEAKKFLLSKGTDLKYGARPLRRSIQRYIEDEISDMILKSEVVAGQTIHVDCKKDELKFSI